MNRRRILPLAALAVLAGVLYRCAPDLHPAFDRRGNRLPTAGAVEWVWTGALEPTSIRLVARLTRPSDQVRLLVATGEGLEEAIASPTHEADEASRLAVRIDFDGLAPGTRYYYALEVDGEVDEARRGTFLTPADGPQTFSFAFGSCARTGSNHPVFDTIRELEPLFLLHLGDLHYQNITRDDPSRFHRAFDRVMRSPAQSRLYRSAPVAYVWDDHDFGGDNSDKSAPSRPAARRVYRELVPHYPLPEGDGGAIYQAFTVGRVRFIVTDSRSEKSPRALRDGPQKTVLGARQKAWLKRELQDARDRYPLIVWASSFPWIAPPRRGADNWGGYHAERLEIARFIEENDVRQLVMLSGDAHMLALDDGSNNRPTGDGPGFPVMHAAALDKRGSFKGGPYSSEVFPGPGHFGLMTVVDDGGETVSVTWSGRDHHNRELIAHRFDLGAVPAAP